MLQRWIPDDGGDAPGRALLEELQQQERIWFAWVCRLHDMHAGSQSPHSAAVLGIAQRRWAEARRALDHEEKQHRQDWRRDAPSDGEDLTDR
jgi:hypothetical protein